MESDRLIIAGSRTLDPTVDELNALIAKPPAVVICGCAEGADRAGFRWARKNSVSVEFFPAWPKQREWALANALSSETIYSFPLMGGSIAGSIRNEQMGRRATAAVLWWDGASPGTKSMADICNRLKIPIAYGPSLGVGDTVVPKRGKGGPWIIASLGSQPSMFNEDEVKVAIFENGSFMALNKLRRAPDAE